MRWIVICEICLLQYLVGTRYEKINFFISLCLHGCAFWGDNVNGEKYKVNKLILIDGNYFEYVSLPEKCQNKLEQNGWNLSKNYEECPHFVKGRIDTLIYSFNAKVTYIFFRKFL
mgnify:FL=1